MAARAPLDIRRVQLARILGLPASTLTGRNAATAIAAHPDELAEAFFQEAAANDDVLSTETALEYLEGRLEFFSGLIPPGTATEIRVFFSERLRAWET